MANPGEGIESGRLAGCRPGQRTPPAFPRPKPLCPFSSAGRMHSAAAGHEWSVNASTRPVMTASVGRESEAYPASCELARYLRQRKPNLQLRRWDALRFPALHRAQTNAAVGQRSGPEPGADQPYLSVRPESSCVISGR